MSTRSLTNVYDGNENCIVTMYRQMDGYPEGHGKDLGEFLANRTVGNGIRFDMPDGIRFSNGPHCLAAQLVCHFKNDNPVGGIYLYPSGQRDCGEEYIYNVYSDHNAPIKVSILDVWKKEIIFSGNVAQFVDYCMDAKQDDDGNYIKKCE